MLKSGLFVKEKKGIKYISGEAEPQFMHPLLSRILSSTGNLIMDMLVLKKSMAVDKNAHNRILKKEFSKLKDLDVLEFFPGRGDSADLLPSSCRYTGFGPETLSILRAKKRFDEKGFSAADFYYGEVENIPFKENSFDVCITAMANDLDKEHAELLECAYSLLKDGGCFISCSPVAEKMKRIRPDMRIHKKADIARIFEENGFVFEPMNHKNGALLYYRAVKKTGDA